MSKTAYLNIRSTYFSGDVSLEDTYPTTSKVKGLDLELHNRPWGCEAECILCTYTW